MRPTEILEGVRELLSDERRWCKGAFARNKDGAKLRYGSDEGARRWDIGGAVDHVASGGYEDGGHALRLIDDEEDLPPDTPEAGPITAFNDLESTTHADMLGLLDRAIERSRAVAA